MASLASRIQIALQGRPIREQALLRGPRHGLVAAHAEIAQHEGDQVPFRVAEIQQPIEAEAVPLRQPKPRGPAPQPPAAEAGRHGGGDASHQPGLGDTRARHLEEAPPQLGRREQRQQLGRRNRRTAFDEAGAGQFRQRRRNIRHLRIAQTILPQHRPPRDEAGQEAQPGRGEAQDGAAEAPFGLGEEVPVALAHAGYHDAQVLGVVVQRWRLRGRQGRPSPGPRGTGARRGHRLSRHAPQRLVRGRRILADCMCLHGFASNAAWRPAAL